MATRWQYRFETFDLSDRGWSQERMFDDLGNEGWEFVTILKVELAGTFVDRYLFERPTD